jgi:glycosyltransferase involved in cell wall biosynthesis
MSRLARWKGLDVLLDAAEILNASGEAADVEFVIAGSTFHEDAVYGEQLASRIATRIPNARLVGHVSDVSSMLVRSDVLVLMSVAPEPFGQVVVQGMAAGLVVIATSHGGPAEVIADGVDGYLIPPGSAEELVALLRTLRHDPTRARDLREAARRKAQDFRDDATVMMFDEAVRRLHEAVQGRRA